MPTQLQYTVRGVPAETDKELRRKAKRRGISFNQLLVEEEDRRLVTRDRHFHYLPQVALWQ